ncbi:MAG TPA: CAP domain-containing protein [Candidatus Limnocylindria bacterium]|nr:CAP domain-containing protein [Candidatus Limnocylindria bacterium]
MRSVLALSWALVAASCVLPARALPEPSPEPTVLVIASPSASASVAPTADPSPSPSAIPSASAAPSGDTLVDTHNALRSGSGLAPVRADPRATEAARRHADYLVRNDASGHDEDPARAGFTGATVAERLAAAGYPGATASEVAARSRDGASSVRALWDLPYHRLGMAHPHLAAVGWAHVGAVTVGVFVYDFAARSADVARVPAPGAREVPRSWSGPESPDPLPAGAARPTGWPILVIYGGTPVVQLRAASLRSAAGTAVDLHAAPQVFERDYVVVIPARPLEARTTYRIRLEVRVGDADRVEEWEFATGT